MHRKGFGEGKVDVGETEEALRGGRKISKKQVCFQSVPPEPRMWV